MNIQEYLPEGVEYDPSGGIIIAYDKEGSFTYVADIRGFGKLTNLLKSEGAAVQFQDKLGRFIADAINEKLKNPDS